MTCRQLAAHLTLLLALAAAGCASRAHMGGGQGRATREALERQAVDPKAGEKPHALKGLDSQEAAVVSTTYRRSLTPKQSGNPEDTVLVVQPQGSQGAAYVPPPSVRERGER